MKTSTICVSCGHTVEGRFCANCGEKVFLEKDKSLWHFFEDGLHFITHLDGTLFNTLRAIATRPGLVSLEYSNGKRKKYFKPLSLFLLLIILYLLFPLASGLNMTLYFHLHNGIIDHFASQKVSSIMAARALTFEEVSVIFHHKSESVSKYLLVIFIPICALFFQLFFSKKRPWFYDHLIFSTEINCFFLLFGFLLFPFSILSLTTFSQHFFHFKILPGDALVSSISYCVLGIYTAFATRRFYGVKLWKASLIALVFIFFHGFIFQVVYKSILFLIVIYLI